MTAGGARILSTLGLATLHVIAALIDLHAQGIVHLDIKPANIYWLPDGTFKLGDLGMAMVGRAASVQSSDGCRCFWCSQQPMPLQLLPTYSSGFM
jgi:serine/threonine protein kinase